MTKSNKMYDPNIPMVSITQEEYNMFVDAKVFLNDVIYLGLNEEQIKDYARGIIARQVTKKL